MKDYIEHRAIMLGEYIIENKATVRSAANKFSLSKSSVHKDITDRLTKTDPLLAREVKAVLDKNKSERHIRGGLATKQKYADLRKSVQNNDSKNAHKSCK